MGGKAAARLLYSEARLPSRLVQAETDPDKEGSLAEGSCRQESTARALHHSSSWTRFARISDATSGWAFKYTSGEVASAR